MKKTKIVKLLAFVLCAVMLLSVFAACEDEEVTTEVPTDAPEESTTEETTEDETDSDTDPVSESESETETEGESETESGSETESDTESDSESETETVTEAGPCDGTHPAKYDSKVHWRDACEEHNVKAVDKKAHQLNFDTGIYQCKVCLYTPECEGVHTKLVYLDASRHYVGPCEYCTFEGNPEEYSKHDFEGRDYICADCGFDPECNGKHGVDNGDGTHTASACDKCGARASDGAVPHENAQCDDTECDVCGAKDAGAGPHICIEDEYYVYACTVCGAEPACGGEHYFEKDAKGHSVIYCPDCGLSGSGMEAHIIAEKTEDVMDSTIYKYACITCGYVASSKEIPATVNKYVAPIVLASSAGFQTTVSAITDENGTYYRAVGTMGGGQHIWLRENYIYPDRPGSGQLAGGGSLLGEKLDIGSARYLVFKARKSDIAEGIKLMLSTDAWSMAEALAENPNANGTTSVATTYEFKLKEEHTWATFVIDLKFLGKQYAPEEDGRYIIDTMSLMQSSSFKTAEDYIDIGYIAFVDDLDEAKTVCDTPTLISIDASRKETVIELSPVVCDGTHEMKHDANQHWLNACDEHGVTAVAKSAHRFSTSGEYKCSVCGYAPECRGVHTNYVSLGKDGHRIGDCEACGFKGGAEAVESHSFATKEVNGVVSDFCTICQYTVANGTSEKSNVYLSPEQLAESAGFHMKESAVSDATGTYYRAVQDATHGAAGQHIWLRESYAGGGGGSLLGDKNPIDIGNSKYIVIKVRVSKSESAVKLMMSTAGWNKEEAYAADPSKTGVGSVIAAVSFKPSETGEWATFVADLEILGKFFAPDADGGYTIDTLYLDNCGNVLATADDYLDIGYIAFVESIDEAKLICDTPELVCIDASANETVIDAGSGSGSDSDCDHVNENFDGECDICGAEVTDPGVYVLTPTWMNDNASSKTSATDGVNAAGNYQMNASGSNIGVTFVNGSSGTMINVGTNKYIVVRVKETNENANGIRLLISTKDNDIHGTLVLKGNGTDGWATYVMDASAVLYGRSDAAGTKTSPYTAEANGDYILDKLYIQQVNGTYSTAELAYIAFANDIDEVMDLISNNGETSEIRLVTDSTTNVWQNGNQVSNGVTTYVTETVTDGVIRHTDDDNDGKCDNCGA